MLNLHRYKLHASCWFEIPVTDIGNTGTDKKKKNPLGIFGENKNTLI